MSEVINFLIIIYILYSAAKKCKKKEKKKEKGEEDEREKNLELSILGNRPWDDNWMGDVG